LTAELAPILPFRWLDGERVVVFGRGRLAAAGELLAPGYVVLTTPRAAAAAPAVIAGAAAVHEVPPGRVDELAGALRSGVAGERLVALGGGRVIDVAKALAAADPPRTVAAIPTTLSGAEMTAVHRHASDVPFETARVRPAIVVNDPALSASQPAQELARSAANALGHAAEGPLTPLRNPVAELAALDAARQISLGFAAPAPNEDARDALALAALLAGYTIGSTGYGLHHVVSQTLARFADVGHGAANAIMLPQALSALARRFPAWNARLAQALGSEPATFAARLRELAGLTGLRAAGVSDAELERCAEEASRRPELQMTPPPADLEELRALYRAAF
jgi:alcohol dehydrogenase class IV